MADTRDFSSAAANAAQCGQSSALFERVLDCGHLAAYVPAISGNPPPPETGTAYCWTCGTNCVVVSRRLLGKTETRKVRNQRKLRSV